MCVLVQLFVCCDRNKVQFNSKMLLVVVAGLYIVVIQTETTEVKCDIDGDDGSQVWRHRMLIFLT